MDFHLIGVGEVLWDLLLSGPQLGGAPANFAYHAHALGAHVHVVTRIGKDDYGREVIRRFHDIGLPESSVQVDESAPTGTAAVTLSGDGVAQFSIQENVAWDCIAANEDALALSHTADAICFGSLAQRSQASRNAIQQLVGETHRDALRIFDINLRRPFYSREIIEASLRLANVLKLNDDELPILAEMFTQSATATRCTSGLEADKERIQRLAQGFDLQTVALTRGPNGSLLYQNKDGVECWSECTSRPVTVVDTVGAGDSFTAALVLGLLQRMKLAEINSIANEVARYVCSQAGATPAIPLELGKKFSAAFE